MSAEQVAMSPDNWDEQWDRLVDLGVATAFDAKRRCSENAPLGSTSPVHQRPASRPSRPRGGAEFQPPERYYDENWEVPPEPLDEEQISRNNKSAMELTLLCMVNRARRIIEACEGNETHALAGIRAMLERRNRERCSKRLPPYPITFYELYILACQKGADVEPGSIGSEVVQDTLF